MYVVRLGVGNVAPIAGQIRARISHPAKDFTLDSRLRTDAAASARCPAPRSWRGGCHEDRRDGPQPGGKLALVTFGAAFEKPGNRSHGRSWVPGTNSCFA